jgi:hypothetical protein
MKKKQTNPAVYRSNVLARIGLFAVGLFWAGALGVRAVDHYVVPPGTLGVTPTANYTTWSTAATNIQLAVNVASNAETVWLSNGYYRVTNQIAVTNRTTVRGFNGATNTIVYGAFPAYTTRVFYVTSTGVLYGLTISNGYWSGSNDYTGGGGVCISNNGLAQNCRIVNNVCSNNGVNAGGGGIYLAGIAGTAMVDACQISYNLCAAGAGGGGALVTNNGLIRNCLIVNNTSVAAGGNGGGVLSGNGAGDITMPYGVINCTIANNSTLNEGGGIALLGPNNYVADCVAFGNSSSLNNYPDIYATGANTNNCYYSCATAVLAPNQGNITNNPLFTDSAAGNWSLKANSPCINAGTNQDWMTTGLDLDGRKRIRYGTVDMGAYERVHEATIYRFWK